MSGTEDALVLEEPVGFGAEQMHRQQAPSLLAVPRVAHDLVEEALAIVLAAHGVARVAYHGQLCERIGAMSVQRRRVQISSDVVSPRDEGLFSLQQL